MMEVATPCGAGWSRESARRGMSASAAGESEFAESRDKESGGCPATSFASNPVYLLCHRRQVGQLTLAPQPAPVTSRPIIANDEIIKDHYIVGSNGLLIRIKP